MRMFNKTESTEFASKIPTFLKESEYTYISSFVEKLEGANSKLCKHQKKKVLTQILDFQSFSLSKPVSKW
jgi:hypothetical protein